MHRTRIEVAPNLDSSRFYVIALREVREKARYKWAVEKIYVCSDHPDKRSAEISADAARIIRADMGWDS